MVGITITSLFKFFLKNSRKLLTKNQFYYNKSHLKRGQSTHLMYVRAPKHFKRGKQHLLFFNSVFLIKNKLLLKNVNFLFKTKNKIIFKILKRLNSNVLTNDILLYRISINFLYSIKF